MTIIVWWWVMEYVFIKGNSPNYLIQINDANDPKECGFYRIFLLAPLKYKDINQARSGCDGYVMCKSSLCQRKNNRNLIKRKLVLKLCVLIRKGICESFVEIQHADTSKCVSILNRFTICEILMIICVIKRKCAWFLWYFFRHRAVFPTCPKTVDKLKNLTTSWSNTK